MMPPTSFASMPPILRRPTLLADAIHTVPPALALAAAAAVSLLII
jgi:hypothetical protein